MAVADDASTSAESTSSRAEGVDESRQRSGEVAGGRGKNVAVDAPVDYAASSDRDPSSSDGGEPGRGAHREAGGNAPALDDHFRGFGPVPFLGNIPWSSSVPGAGFDWGSSPMIPVLLPAPFPAIFPPPAMNQQPQQGGVFAVPVMPMFGPMGGIPHGGFVPLSFNLPPVPPAPPAQAEGQTQPAGAPAADAPEGWRADLPAEAGHAAPADGLRQRHVAGGAAAFRPRQGENRVDEPQRHQQQVVRRFQVGFQLDLLLILKLAVVVIVFNQDGTKNRLVLLLLVAGLVYLYQTGALTPIINWISLSARRAMMPPQQPVAGGAAHRDAAGAPLQDFGRVPGRPEPRREAPPVRQAVNGGGLPREGPLVEGPPGTGVQNELPADQLPQNGNWWGIIKEVQMIVVGFLTSLLPGFPHGE